MAHGVGDARHPLLYPLVISTYPGEGVAHGVGDARHPLLYPIVISTYPGEGVAHGVGDAWHPLLLWWQEVVLPHLHTQTSYNTETVT